MSVQMGGGVEYRTTAGGPWLWAGGLYPHYTGQDYDLFGSVFGVRNYTGIDPLAEGRGMPADVSSACARARDPETFGATWVTLDELEAVDWDELGAHVDARVHRYVRGVDGAWRYESKSVWNRDLDEHAGVSSVNAQEYPEGSEWQVGDALFRVHRLTRREAGGDGLRTLVEHLRACRATYDAVGVRLVVWFEP